MGNLEFLAKPRECEKTRTETAEEIEKAIKTYQMPGDAGWWLIGFLSDEAVLLHSEVRKLRAPAKTTLKAFKQWFLYEPPAPKLRGHSSRMWEDDNDLVALRVPAEQDCECLP